MKNQVGDPTFLEAVAISPVKSATETPEPLKSLPVVTADYRAVPPFPNYIGGSLMRLAPLAGVLGYDKDGQVIDLKAGQRATHQVHSASPFLQTTVTNASLVTGVE